MCIGCHGIVGLPGQLPAGAQVCPRSAGQGAKYIVSSALGAYKKGDRKHPTMRAIAASLSRRRTWPTSAAFYESAGWRFVAEVGGRHAGSAPAAPAEVAALLTKGACASCHGANFSKPIDPAYPKLAGQYGDYLYRSP